MIDLYCTTPQWLRYKAIDDDGNVAVGPGVLTMSRVDADGVVRGGRTMNRPHAFLRGWGGVLSINPPRRRFAIGSGIIDRSATDALASDWRAVGNDIRRALGKAAERDRRTGTS